MNRHDGSYLSKLSPVSLADYLNSTGWTIGETSQHITDYHRDTATVMVPTQQEWRDYGTMVALLIGELARVECRSTYELVSDIQKMGATS